MRTLLTCPACGSNKIHYSYTGRTGRIKEENVWTLDACEECDHEFMNPQPTWEELGRYYSPDYSPYEASTAEEEDDEVVARARQTSEFRHLRIKAGDRLLDVGCGGGYYLRIVRRMGVEAEGIEPSAYAADVARQTGLPIFCGTLEEYVARAPEKRFDVITSNHVLEHVPEPVETLEAMRRVLAPGGLIWISVPNAQCQACRTLRDRWHSTDLPFHLMQFSPESLRRSGERSGLRVRSLTSYSLPSATAESIRTILRRRYAVPARLTAKIGLIDHYLAPRYARRIDARDAWEAARSSHLNTRAESAPAGEGRGGPHRLCERDDRFAGVTAQRCQRGDDRGEV